MGSSLDNDCSTTSHQALVDRLVHFQDTKTTGEINLRFDSNRLRDIGYRDYKSHSKTTISDLSIKNISIRVIDFESRNVKESRTFTRPISQHIISCRQKERSHRPVVNMKNLNSHVPSFNMEGLLLIRELLEKNDYVLKMDLKDATSRLLCSPKAELSKFLKVQVRRDEFLCLCSGLSLASLVFFFTNS